MNEMDNIKKNAPYRINDENPDDDNLFEKYDNYITLENLEIYKLARQLSQLSWKAFDKLDWHDKKIMGDQFISSIDSVGANIAEGYRRFHYLDKIKFFYNSRASLSESTQHWLELLLERNKISQDEFNQIKKIANALSIKLANFIKTTYQQKALNG